MKSVIILFTILLILLIFYSGLCTARHGSKSIERWSLSPVPVRTVHLVLFSNTFPYNEMLKITREWYRTISEVTTIYYCYDPSISKPYDYNETDMILKIRGSETYTPGILNKTLDAFAFVLAHFPYVQRVIRSNVSTILDLRKMAKECGPECVYGGYMVNKLAWLDPAGGVTDERWFGTRYASGTCIIMSRDLLLDMMRKREKFRTELIDDLSIGVWMKEHAPSVPIWSSQRSDWFFRNRKANRVDDINTMKELVKRLLNQSKHTN